MKIRISVTLAVLAALCATVAASALGDDGHPGKDPGKPATREYLFRGQLVSATSTSLQMTVRGGDHDGLKLLINQPTTETFTINSSTQVLVSDGHAVHRGSLSDLHGGDSITVHVKAPAGASLPTILATPATIVSDHTAHPQPKPPVNHIFLFRGPLISATASSVQMTVRSGDRDALRLMRNQPSTQTFAINSSTRILVNSGHSVRSGSVSDLHAGDQVTVHVKALQNASLGTVESTAATVVSDQTPQPRPKPRPTGPAFLYVGTVSGGQPAGHVTLHVTSGNWRGLRTMLGQSLDQTFTTDSGTQFLLWQDGHASRIDPSQLRAGDRITVWVHQSPQATLAQVEATPASRVGDHEPGNPGDQPG